MGGVRDFLHGRDSAEERYFFSFESRGRKGRSVHGAKVVNF